MHQFNRYLHSILIELCYLHYKVKKVNENVFGFHTTLDLEQNELGSDICSCELLTGEE
jgi:hypothetical protein